MPSNRKFGLTFAVVFALFAAFSLWKGSVSYRFTLPIAALFLVAALAAPALLQPLNRVWFRFGAVLHRVVSPVVLLVLYAVLIVPAGSVMRLVGNDPLRRKLDSAAASYWETVPTAEVTLDRMRRQF